MILTIDIGGTNTRVAISEDKKNILKKVSFETAKNFHDEISLIKKHTDELLAGNSIISAVAGVPGVVDVSGTIVSSPNLTQWQGQNISQALSTTLGIKTTIINDAELATLGEAVFGAGKNYNVVAYVTVSTGIGGGRVINKKFDIAFSGFEPGRQIMDYKTGQTLQDLVSGAGVKNETGKVPREIVDEAFWKNKADILAEGMWNTIVHWSPEILILGGPMILRKPGIKLADVIAKIKSIDAGTVPVPEIVLSTLGDDVGLYGGLAVSV